MAFEFTKKNKIFDGIDYLEIIALNFHGIVWVRELNLIVPPTGQVRRDIPVIAAPIAAAYKISFNILIRICLIVKFNM